MDLFESKQRRRITFLGSIDSTSTWKSAWHYGETNSSISFLGIFHLSNHIQLVEEFRQQFQAKIDQCLLKAQRENNFDLWLEHGKYQWMKTRVHLQLAEDIYFYHNIRIHHIAMIGLDKHGICWQIFVSQPSHLRTVKWPFN